MTEETVITKRRGRPPKALAAKVEPKAELKAKPKLRNRPNWVNMDTDDDAGPDRLRLSKEFLEKHSEYAFQWVADSVLGQPDPQHRGGFEKNGWTPVCGDDFDGDLDGEFMKKGTTTEINVGGLILMANRKEHVEKRRAQERRAAVEQVRIKEQALRGGDMPISLDAQHETALRTNRINKTVERIDIPDK